MNTQLDEKFDLSRKVLTAGELALSESTGLAKEVEAFVAWATLCKIPVEIINVNVDNKEPLPLSVKGRTHIKYVGTAPMVSAELDANDNLVMAFVGAGAVEVTFNSERIGAHGKNRGPHGKKKVYIVQ